MFTSDFDKTPVVGGFGIFGSGVFLKSFWDIFEAFGRSNKTKDKLSNPSDLDIKAKNKNKASIRKI